MKKIGFFLLTLVSLSTVQAQKVFDSAAYVQFYQKQWGAFQPDTFTHTQLLTNEEKLAGLSKCWAEAKYNFANFDLQPLLNWDSLYQAFIPKVLATESNERYFKTLQHFYQYLHDGHSGVMLPLSHWREMTGALPLEIRWVENKAVITKNTSTRKEDAVIKPGMELIAFNDILLQQYVQENISPYMSFSTPQDSIERIYRFELLPGKAGSEAALTIKGFDGKAFTKKVKRVAMEKFWEPYPLVVFKVLKGNIGYLQVNSFNDSKVVSLYDSLFPSIAKTNALIIDVRNNGGGNGNNGFELLASLTDQPFYPGKSALRYYRPVGRAWGGIEKTEIEGYDWKPYKKQLYTQPVVVLTSGATYSAAEDFTATFKYMKRGTIIGAPTGGSTGQPVSFNLPGGAFARVCAKRDFLWDGTEFVGIGIQPDILVQPTIEGVKGGKDEVLEAAVQYLRTSKSL